MRKFINLTVGAAAALIVSSSASAGILFVGTDADDFAGGPDKIGKVTVSGAAFVSQVIIPLPAGVRVNGLGDGPGFLYAGEALTNTLRTIDYNGVPLTAVPAGFDSGCCNEEMQFYGGKFYHAHWNTNIQEINPVTGAVIQTFAERDVVGMAQVGAELWITHWEARQVGRWNPGTGVFTPVFSTPSNAGALAYDPDAGILWVGQAGGVVVPYTLGGIALNAGFFPFGPALNGTIDGLTFLGESRQTPEPATVALVAAALLGLAVRRRRSA